jgi:predicted nucleotidyltransferase
MHFILGVQQRLLALIFGHPDKSFYMSEIVRTLRSGTGAVERELVRLQQSGLVSVERIGNQKHFRANRKAPIFQELYGIIQKTIGLHDPLRHSLELHADRIQVAFVYGSIAKGTDTSNSDIDLMVIGDDLTYSDLYSGLEEAEKSLARPINPTILDLAQWNRMRSEKISFIEKVSGQPKVFIFGTEADLSGKA